jgi:hypothetical protein
VLLWRLEPWLQGAAAMRDAPSAGATIVRQAGTPDHAGDITMEIPASLFAGRVAVRAAVNPHDEAGSTLVAARVEVPAQRRSPDRQGADDDPVQ